MPGTLPRSRKKWIREKGYTFPVLVDDGYVGDQRVGSFPTTWLVDRRGRLCYEMHGENSTLMDEYSWLIEELKRR